jgi:GNAT superfamily N-acetyltransferase
MVRTFCREDQPVAEALIQAGMAERWGATYDPAMNPDVADLWTSYVAAGADVVVAEVDGAVVATGILLAVDGTTGRIRRMSVDAAHRRRGLARQVVGELLGRAARRGLTRVVVRTDTPWTDAVALYRSCGFEIEAQDDIATDLTLDVVPMEAP